MFGFFKDIVYDGYKKIKECFGINTIEYDKILIEKTLLEQNFMPELVKKIIERIELNQKEWKITFKEFLLELFSDKNNIDIESMQIIILIGINGSGKTTSSIKLARSSKDFYKTIVVPADTFRAAAKDQLKELAKEFKVDFFDHNYDQPSTVIFKAAEYCKENNYEKVIIDTAGRIHQNEGLMRELIKSIQTVKKQFQDKKIVTLLVLDGLQGKNLLEQATLFKNNVSIDGIILTKLDAQVKPGILFSIVDILKIPIIYLGVGQKESNLVLFDSNEFVNMFFN
jgi:fused signal recognition particle receptor